jgi:2'-5' RNA ligase
MFRGFIAVEVESSPRLEDFSRAIKATDAPLKMVKLDIIHVTLKFLGDTDEALIPEIEKVMKDATEGIQPFNVKIKGTGAFPNLNRISVVWAGMVNAESLGQIARKLNQGLEPLGFKPEKKRFSPHVTIARVKGGRNKDKVAEAIRSYENEEFSEVEVNRIVLKKSVLTPQGPIYSDVMEVSLE